MEILGLNIAAFGKLLNKEIPLRPGTNVITGDNESGKTTIAVFLKSMLYGMDDTDSAYERYYPLGFQGVYGGSMTVLSKDTVYEIRRSFLKSNPDLKIIRTEDGEEIEDTEAWFAEHRGELTRAEYEASGYIAQNALTKDAQSLEEKGMLTEAEKKEAENRSRCLSALSELTGKKRALKEKIDDTLNDRSGEVFRGIEEKELSIKELTAEEAAVSEDLEARRSSLEQDIKTIDDANARRTTALHGAMLEKKEQLSEYTEFNEKALKKTTTPGIILMAAGFIMAAVSAFLLSSYKMEGKWQYITIICFLIAGGLSAAGIIMTVVRVNRKNIALGRQSAEREYREDAEKAEADYQYFVDHMDEVGEKVKDRTAREQAVHDLEAKAAELHEKLSAETSERDRLRVREQEFRALLEKQEATLKEITDVDEAIASVTKLGRLDPLGNNKSFSELAGEWLGKIAPGRDDTLLVSEDGTLSYSGTDASLRPFRMNNSRAQEISLSLRLALFSSLDPEGILPMILDDTFTDFDANRLEELMELIKEDPRQVIVLTCHAREKNTY
ncbi:MAG: AAA family ATPase [Lachnospiraceae bacterium]|nr:AAA family ATPase [Lachnospiraceae bacterium]